MTDALDFLLSLPALHAAGDRKGITSVCSAHPTVIEAALIEAAATHQFALIEATCNQVNQDGGYTGMTPLAVRAFVLNIAKTLNFPASKILFGGDHLGPNPWRKLPADQAMAKALTMTHAYAAAGFAKIHLDASMSCADDPTPLPPATIATRAALLAQAAEAGAISQNLPPPAYIIGTEVPVPGGATHALTTLEISNPTDAATTIALHEASFAALNLTAFPRVIALVVQPGVEFGHTDVIPYDPTLATALKTNRPKNILYEAHSTDYQTAEALRHLVQDGFAILKVGPGLTFALREALYALDLIASELTDYPAQSLPKAMDALMQAQPSDWQAYYHGTPRELHLMRHFSYSDRIRYYWNQPQAQAATAQLFTALQDQKIPAPLISQYLPRLTDTEPAAKALTLAAVRAALAPYSQACLEPHPR